MTYIEAPDEYEPAGGPCLFLAGGISDCDGWQWRLAEMLSPLDLVVLNPRRKQFPMDDPSAAEGQIRWEFRHLRRATARLFWFPSTSLCPIALYELGAWSMAPGPLFVGVDPKYARRQDVEMQTRLVRPEVRVRYSVEELGRDVRQYARRGWSAGVTQ